MWNIKFLKSVSEGYSLSYTNQIHYPQKKNGILIQQAFGYTDETQGETARKSKCERRTFRIRCHSVKVNILIALVYTQLQELFIV